MKRLNIIVTGTTEGGIGYEIARRLVSQGHQLLITSRSLERAERSALLIAGTEGGLPPAPYALDLTSSPTIDDFVKSISGNGIKPHILINNAGFMKTGCYRSPTGLEMSMAVNYFGTRELTEKIHPLMAKGGRIINVTSSTAFLGRIKRDDCGFRAYFNSKYALNMYSRELADRLSHRGITVNAVHPGNIITNIWTDLWPRNNSLGKLIGLIDKTGLISAAKGSETPLELALSSHYEGKTDGYYLRGHRKEWHGNCKDKDINLINLERLHQCHTV